MPRLILYTSQGRGDAQVDHVYPVRDRDHAQEAAQHLQTLAVEAHQEPVRFKVLPLEELPS